MKSMNEGQSGWLVNGRAGSPPGPGVLVCLVVGQEAGIAPNSQFTAEAGPEQVASTQP